jgi:chloramphenicol O-acetyltransferase
MFVNLIWPWCHCFSKFDIDEFARVRQVVNEINMYDSLTVFYTITDSDDVALHIKKNFLLVPQIPEVEEFLRMILNGFFGTARSLDLEIEKSRMQECEK